MMLPRHFASTYDDSDRTQGFTKALQTFPMRVAVGHSASGGTRSSTAVPFSSATSTRRLSTSNGLPLNLLVDAAIGKVSAGGNGNKRSLEDTTKLQTSPPSSPYKKPRVEVQVPPMSNPKLMERLTSLSGGFPMPKWGNFKKKQKSAIAQEALKVSEDMDTSNNSHMNVSRVGGFPMPSLLERKQPQQPPSLQSFQQLWQETHVEDSMEDDLELRKELFSRKLHKAKVQIGGTSDKRMV
mmetsp:Transcript_14989/g.24244  ORF Transcript_14989/g.24244 Transcript_14989/m.24244 type:complete len:239 (-) Transcript_14989:545-1261(-)